MMSETTYRSTQGTIPLLSWLTICVNYHNINVIVPKSNPRKVIFTSDTEGECTERTSVVLHATTYPSAVAVTLEAKVTLIGDFDDLRIKIEGDLIPTSLQYICQPRQMEKFGIITV